jgi:hypothetical protein
LDVDWDSFDFVIHRANIEYNDNTVSSGITEPVREKGKNYETPSLPEILKRRVIITPTLFFL